jgi:hypothetical protein
VIPCGQDPVSKKNMIGPIRNDQKDENTIPSNDTDIKKPIMRRIDINAYNDLYTGKIGVQPKKSWDALQPRKTIFNEKIIMNRLLMCIVPCDCVS